MPLHDAFRHLADAVVAPHRRSAMRALLLGIVAAAPVLAGCGVAPGEDAASDDAPIPTQSDTLLPTITVVDEANVDTGTSAVTTATTVDDLHVEAAVELTAGDTGLPVEVLQRALKALGYSPGKVDGVYGKRTSVAVGAFQRDRDIEATGTADERTLEAINHALDDR